MTLSKQLVLLISVMFLAIFAINYATSVTNIRSFLQIESEIQAQDTATSLGLSLSPYLADPSDTMLETIINAVFDRGYYLEILLEDTSGRALVRKTNPRTFSVVPEWFTRLLPMETATASSEISSGWQIGGVVHVTVHPGFGYLKVWEQAKRALNYSVAAFVVSILVLAGIVRLLLRPLARIDRLARDVADGHFGAIEPLPWTREMRNVATSMNLMSGKIEGMIHHLNDRLAEAGTRLRIDVVTGLETRSTFDTEVKQMFIAGARGYVLFLRVDDLAGFAGAHSNEAVDAFLKGLASRMLSVAAEFPQAQLRAFRFVGSEFALLAGSMDRAGAEAFCARLMEALAELGRELDKPSVAHVGAVAFDPQGTIGSLLAGAKESYEKARLIGQNSYAISEESSRARTMDAWAQLVADVIAKGSYRISLVARAMGLSRESDGHLLLEEAVAEVRDEAGSPIPIGTFVSVAENLGRITDFDREIVKRVLDYMRAESVAHEVAVNLSFASMASVDFRSELYRLLQEHQEPSAHLVFSVTAYGAAKDLSVFESFIELAHRCGTKVMLKRFETRFIPLDKIQRLKLDYIRLARVYTEDIGTDPGKQRVVEAMKELGDLLDIKVVAESVEADADLAAVRSIGLYAASR